MREVGMLVQQQGEMIDNIYKNVLEAKDYTGKTVGVLVQQKKEHKTSRKVCYF
jgi:phosphoserine phosphatase